MRRIATLLLLAALTALPARAEVDTKKLQSLLSLPPVELEASFHFSAWDLRYPEGQQELPGLVERLKKQLQGDDSDGERYRELGDAYAALKDDARAQEAYAKSAAAFQGRVKAREDAASLTGLGRALQEVGQFAEAEAGLRKAVMLEPKSWRAWAALADALQRRAMQELYALETPEERLMGARALRNPGKLYDPLSREVMARGPRSAQSLKVSDLLNEASAHMKKAVELAPDEPEVHLRQAGGLVVEGVLFPVMRYLEQNKPNEGSLRQMATNSAIAAMASVSVIEDLQQIARLRPDLPRILGVLATMKVLNWARHSAPFLQLGSGRTWAALPADVKNEATGTMDLLQKRSEGKDRTAADAAEQLGLLRFLIADDREKAQAAYRRALELEPGRDHTWELLLATALPSGDFAQAAVLAEERVKTRDTLRNRLLLGSIYNRLEKPGQAAEHLRRAAALEPKAFVPNLAAGTILMKLPVSQRTMQEAQGYLVRAQEATDVPLAQKGQLGFAAAVFHALSGNAGEARRILNGMLQTNPGNETLKAALEALGPA